MEELDYSETDVFTDGTEASPETQRERAAEEQAMRCFVPVRGFLFLIFDLCQFCTDLPFFSLFLHQFSASKGENTSHLYVSSWIVLKARKRKRKRGVLQVLVTERLRSGALTVTSAYGDAWFMP